MTRPVQLTAFPDHAPDLEASGPSCWFHAGRDATRHVGEVAVCDECAERITARLDRFRARRVPRPIDGAA